MRLLPHTIRRERPRSADSEKPISLGARQDIAHQYEQEPDTKRDKTSHFKKNPEIPDERQYIHVNKEQNDVNKEKVILAAESIDILPQRVYLREDEEQTGEKS